MGVVMNAQGNKMIKDLSVDEFKFLITNATKEALEDVIEDISALSSKKYIKSIKEARRDYKEGRVKRFEDVFKI